MIINKQKKKKKINRYILLRTEKNIIGFFSFVYFSQLIWKMLNERKKFFSYTVYTI